MPIRTVRTFSVDHWKSPFEFAAQYKNGNKTTHEKREISRQQKVMSIALAIFLLPGGLFVFYALTAYFKNRTIGQIKNKVGFQGILAKYRPELSNHQKTNAKAKTSALPPYKLEDLGPLPPPPKDGIKMGLVNSGNTCWLNACLKFIASTSHFDGLFDVDTSQLKKPKIMSRLQLALKEAIRALRQGAANSTINKKLYLALVHAVSAQLPGKGIGTKQQDASEFFKMFLADLNYPFTSALNHEREDPSTLSTYPRLIKHYLAESTAQYKSHRKDNFSPILYVHTHYAEQGNPLEISTILNGRKERIENLIDDYNNMGTFTQVEQFVNLPKTLILQAQRTHYVSDDQGTYSFKKSKQKLDFGPEGTLELIECDPKVVKKDRFSYNTPKFRCFYQPEAAIIHEGNSMDSGHFVCNEQAQDGKIFLHNDTSVSGGQVNWEDGFLIRLRLVKKERLSEEEKDRIVKDLLCV